MPKKQNHPQKTHKMEPVFLYGTEDCASTRLVRNYLEKLEIQYTYRDLDIDPEAARQVRGWTGGPLSHPVLQVGQTVAIEPDIRGLQAVLEQNGLI